MRVIGGFSPVGREAAWMTLFRLKAIVMLSVTAVWVLYILSAVYRGGDVGLEWLGLPGAVFFALFGQIRRRNGNGSSNGSTPES